MDPIAQQAAQQVEHAKQRFLKTLSHVPDDKLEWTPSDTAKSALRITAHTGLSCGFFAMMVRGDKLPDLPAEELAAHMEASEKAITTRADAIAALDGKVADLVATLQNVTPERLAASVDTPFGPWPVTEIVGHSAQHITDHAAQIDYLQSIWGDLGFYM